MIHSCFTENTYRKNYWYRHRYLIHIYIYNAYGILCPGKRIQWVCADSAVQTPRLPRYVFPRGCWQQSRKGFATVSLLLAKKRYNVSKEEKNLIQHEIPMISILHSTCRDSVLQSCFLSNNDMSLLIFRDSNWLVVSNMNFIFHFIYRMSSFPLTNSIIFQDGFLTTYHCWSIAISTYFVDCMVPFPGHGQVDVYNFRRRAFGNNVPNGGLSML